MAKRNVTWHELQQVLMETTTEEEVLALIKAEQKGPNRARWLMRMQGRYNVLRRQRECDEILARAV